MDDEALAFESPAAWEAWLSEHHEASDGIWIKFAKKSTLPDFDARDELTGRTLADLFAWTEDDFLRRTEGSPIRRIGHERWLRNIAVALGNAVRASEGGAKEALATRAEHPSELVREHVAWGLAQRAD